MPSVMTQMRRGGILLVRLGRTFQRDVDALCLRLWIGKRSLVERDV